MDKRTLTLSVAEQQELAYLRDHDRRAYVRERAAALLKIQAGHSPYWVARCGLLKPRDPDTVYSWLDRYQAQGVVGLVMKARGRQRRPP